MKRGLSGELFSRHCEEECPQPCPVTGCTWKGPLPAINSHVARECLVKRQQELEEAKLVALQLEHRQLLETLNPPSQEVVRLNVSGNPISFAKSALDKIKGSLLHSLVHGTWQPERDDSGAAFVNSPFLPFSLIVNWLQSGVVPAALPAGLDPYCLYCEVVFWRIVNLLDALRDNLFVGKQLDGSNFRGGRFPALRFCGSSLSWTNFQDADLSSSDFRHANMSEANLSNCTLRNANLRSANLAGAYLSGATLIGCDLNGADLSNCDLRGSDLSDADLSSANLSGANLAQAKMVRCNLSGANLTDANLSSCNLTKANVIDATVKNTHIDRTILVGVKGRSILEVPRAATTSLGTAPSLRGRPRDLDFTESRRFPN
jgi:uncharacterized protein YjbI with pentapeptide repeats